MDERIWSELPVDVLDRIVARLPVPILCQLRCFCKKWDSLPRSPSFPELCSNAPPELPYLVFPSINSISSEASLSTFCPTLSQWYKLPLCSLHPKINLHLWPPGQKALIAADAGLLCFTTTAVSPESHCKRTIFIVVNPITNAWRQLPSVPNSRSARPPRVTGLHVDKSTKSFKLIVAGYLSSNGDWGTHLYDSGNQSWEEGCGVDSSSDFNRQCTFYNGSFYCLNYYPRLAIRKYCAQEGIWRNVNTKLPPFMRYPGLVERNGRLLIVGPVQDTPPQVDESVEYNYSLGRYLTAADLSDVPNTIEIFELEETRMEWVKVDAKPPEDGFADLFRGPYRYYFVRCIGQGDLIYASRDDASAILAFDFSEKLWRWLPDNPTTIEPKDSWQVLAFNPHFTFAV